MKKFNRFGYVYRLLQRRHSNWTHKQLVRCTLYALNKRKITIKSLILRGDINVFI